MYFTAVVDKAVKPARPVPNFKVDRDGLTVRFQNLSMGGSGWWEFGDGSPLEPVSSDQEFLSHTYPRPGDYLAKMSLTNLVGDEVERSVTIRIDIPGPTGPPQIASLEATAVAGSYAPATFHLVSKVNNAQVYVWDLGDDRPLEIVTDGAGNQERMVTFNKPGSYRVKLAAVNGTQHDEKIQTVAVLEPPANTVTAVLTVEDQGTQVKTRQRPHHFCQHVSPQARDAVFALDERQLALADPGWIIRDVRVQGAGGHDVSLGGRTEMGLDTGALGLRHARNLRLKLAEDRRSVRLTGELVRDPAGNDTMPPCLCLPVVLTEEKRAPAQPLVQNVTATLPLPAGGVPTAALIPLPRPRADWVDVNRKMHLELRDAGRVVWQDTQLAHAAPLTVQNRRFALTATPRGADQVRVDLVEETTPAVAVPPAAPAATAAATPKPGGK
jgi:PKD repeat protein